MYEPQVCQESTNKISTQHRTSKNMQLQQEVSRTSKNMQLQQEVSRISKKMQLQQEISRTSKKMQLQQEVSRTSKKMQLQKEISSQRRHQWDSYPDLLMLFIVCYLYILIVLLYYFLQEMPEKASAEQLPRSVDIIYSLSS